MVIGLIGLLLSGLSLTLATGRARTTDVVSVAQRLTALEKAGDSMPKGLSERLAALEQKTLWPERLAERLAAVEQVLRAVPDVQQVLTRLIAVETKIDLFWRGLSLDAARVLHSPHPQWARRDALLEAFMAHRLASDEAAELGALLLDVFDDHEADPGQRMAAAVVLKYLHGEYAVNAVNLSRDLNR